MHTQDTIIAQCTPKGTGALALLRISGPEACNIATYISKLSANKIINTVPTHTIHYGTVRNESNETIDQVLFFVMHAPKTFTGQDTVEISCHNNPFIIQAIIDRAINCGARIAHNGEFSKRAVLNGKIDLVQAEAIHDVIGANTQQALKNSLAQLHGNLSYEITAIEKHLIKALALSEASFEFIDEEDIHFGSQIHTILTSIIININHIEKTYDIRQQIKDGARVALIGSVNAGKSSLFNALLGKDRAIVTNIAGTTRDVIETGVYRKSMYITFVDTAGLRSTNDSIEKQGIERSHKEALNADLVLVIVDGSSILTPQEKKIYQEILTTYTSKIILVYTKQDLPQQNISFDTHKTYIPVSTLQQHTVDKLEETVSQKLHTLFSCSNSPYMLNTRQVTLLRSLKRALEKTITQLNNNAETIHYELVSHNLTEALSQCSELTGKSITQTSMDAIFKEFCIGK